MSAIQNRVFKCGNSAAVRLPKELGFEIGATVTIEKVGQKLTITPVVDPAKEKRALLDMIDEIEEIWKDVPPHPDRGRRDPIEFPERPGL